MIFWLGEILKAVFLAEPADLGRIRPHFFSRRQKDAVHIDLPFLNLVPVNSRDTLQQLSDLLVLLCPVSDLFLQRFGDKDLSVFAVVTDVKIDSRVFLPTGT